MHQSSTPQRPGGLSRRSFLGYAAASAAVALLPARLEAAPTSGHGDRTLSFFHTHTGERLDVAYCCSGTYDPEALRRIDRVLRDFRTGEVKPIDPKLLDLLFDLRLALRTGEPYHVISGYRSPQTNTLLRTRGGGADSGVAVRSLHMVGKAIDIRVPGVNLARLRAAATSLSRGGVGYYPAPDFVHVDTGRVRSW